MTIEGNQGPDSLTPAAMVTPKWITCRLQKIPTSPAATTTGAPPLLQLHATPLPSPFRQRAVRRTIAPLLHRSITFAHRRHASSPNLIQQCSLPVLVQCGRPQLPASSDLRATRPFAGMPGEPMCGGWPLSLMATAPRRRIV